MGAGEEGRGLAGRQQAGGSSASLLRKEAARGECDAGFYPGPARVKGQDMPVGKVGKHRQYSGFQGRR